MKHSVCRVADDFGYGRALYRLMRALELFDGRQSARNERRVLRALADLQRAYPPPNRKGNGR